MTNVNEVKMLPRKQVVALIDRSVKTTAKGLELIHEASVQCILHAEKHGDVTLAQKLMQDVKDNCKGVVVAGLAKWFQDYSPVRLTSENGEVKASLLKAGEKGYKAFDTKAASENVAMEAPEVKNRAERPITKPTIAFFKQRISGFAKQVDRFQETAPEDQKMTQAEVNTIKLWLNSVTEFGNKVTVMEEKPAEKLAPQAVVAADRLIKGPSRNTARKAKGQLPAETEAKVAAVG